MTVIVIEIKKINVIVIDIILCNWTQPWTLYCENWRQAKLRLVKEEKWPI